MGILGNHEIARPIFNNSSKTKREDKFINNEKQKGKNKRMNKQGVKKKRNGKGEKKKEEADVESARDVAGEGGWQLAGGIGSHVDRHSTWAPAGGHLGHVSQSLITSYPFFNGI